MALFQCGVRLAQVGADVADIERKAVAVMATVLPATIAAPKSTHEAHMAGLAVDEVELALTQASPRLAALAKSYESIARAVRRAAALIHRLDTGWRPRAATIDDRPAMARRQIARSVGERIARHAEGDAAERLFDDLDEALDELDTRGEMDRPTGELIEAICRDLGLANAALPEAARLPVPPAPNTSVQHTPDG